MKANFLPHQKHIVIYHCSYGPGNVTNEHRRWLSEQETQRLAGMKSARRQAEFSLSRCLMKRKLGFTEGQASRVPLLLSKGYLCIEGYPEYAISLTHSSENIAFSVFDPRRSILGLDLEEHNHRRKFGELSSMFSPDERTTCSEAFYRTWTLKEALAKTLNSPLQSMLSTPAKDLLEQHDLSFYTQTFPEMTVSLVHNLSSDLPVIIQSLSA